MAMPDEQDAPGLADRATYVAIIVSVMLTIGLIGCIYMFYLTRSGSSDFYDQTPHHTTQARASGTGVVSKP